MRAADVQPNRLVAAQEAAKALRRRPAAQRQGRVVAFAGTAAVVQAPTAEPRRRHRRDRPLPAAARHRHRQRHRALAGDALPRSRHRPVADHRRSAAMPPGPNDKPPPEFTPVPPGSYSSAAIILLTDGQRTTGPDSLEAAKMAADRGVRVYTVGIGTKDGETIGFEGWSMRVRLDEDTLKAIAKHDQRRLLLRRHRGRPEEGLPGAVSSRLIVEKKETEISALLAAARRGAGGARRGPVGLVVRARSPSGRLDTSLHVRRERLVTELTRSKRSPAPEATQTCRSRLCTGRGRDALIAASASRGTVRASERGRRAKAGQ